MSKTKFTNGPWFKKGKRVFWQKPDHSLPKDNLFNGLVCICAATEDNPPEVIEEAHANAALIAAAPEMYDMLEEVKGKLDRSARISIGHSMGAGWSREQAKGFFMEYIEINKRIKAVLQKARG